MTPPPAVTADDEGRSASQAPCRNRRGLGRCANARLRASASRSGLGAGTVRATRGRDDDLRDQPIANEYIESVWYWNSSTIVAG